MASNTPMFSAVSSSARQLLLLLRCIGFTKKALVRISADGLRFSTEEGSTMESFIFLERALFTSYKYNPPPALSSQDDPPSPPSFEINLISLLETLNIFSLSDPNMAKRLTGGYDDFAAHRLNRHAGTNAFSNHSMGVIGVCIFNYDGMGTPLSIHMSEAGVTTTCDLTTYEADHAEEIPFNRNDVSLKTIMRASSLLDAITELSSMTPASVAIHASPTSSRVNPNLSFSAAGALGSATVDFTTTTSSDTPILETFNCATRITANYRFSALKAAQRAMAAATKVSVRMDSEGVLSLQFLVEVDAAGSTNGGGGGSGAQALLVAFVDFRFVPLVEGEDEADVDREASGTDSE
ncbi:checkpoint clamp complex protein Rad1 [Friedmanniomyces endolithicus]|uniref:Checkpoint clamp complex protein Rad1 n=1 Tax=Rachicladosporium monterosium TaxID=1507873 RepID=A0ABR0L0T2_9PEZI|nr:checkpoint clamp complex protein Rad1 [Friedmanniomyces endolithicus]KAK1083989.1 checkpoint clamp complex protein Rad1 [Friedmanniomyces endolithicus]KAK5141724.1 checkpoint clamp complex protein Rad1 [Rachicladosporium monterosium]